MKHDDVKDRHKSIRTQMVLEEPVPTASENVVDAVRTDTTKTGSQTATKTDKIVDIGMDRLASAKAFAVQFQEDPERATEHLARVATHMLDPRFGVGGRENPIVSAATLQATLQSILDDVAVQAKRVQRHQPAWVTLMRYKHATDPKFRTLFLQAWDFIQPFLLDMAKQLGHGKHVPQDTLQQLQEILSTVRTRVVAPWTQLVDTVEAVDTRRGSSSTHPTEDDLAIDVYREWESITSTLLDGMRTLQQQIDAADFVLRRKDAYSWWDMLAPSMPAVAHVMRWFTQTVLSRLITWSATGLSLLSSSILKDLKFVKEERFIIESVAKWSSFAFMQGMRDPNGGSANVSNGSGLWAWILRTIFWISSMLSSEDSRRHTMEEVQRKAQTLFQQACGPIKGAKPSGCMQLDTWQMVNINKMSASWLRIILEIPARLSNSLAELLTLDTTSLVTRTIVAIVIASMTYYAMTALVHLGGAKLSSLWRRFEQRWQLRTLEGQARWQYDVELDACMRVFSRRRNLSPRLYRSRQHCENAEREMLDDALAAKV